MPGRTLWHGFPKPENGEKIFTRESSGSFPWRPLNPRRLPSSPAAKKGGSKELTAEEAAAQINVSDKPAGDSSLYLKGGPDKSGHLSPHGPYSSIFFLRGTAAAGLVSDNPTRSVLPLAKKLDTELKKMEEPEKQVPGREACSLHFSGRCRQLQGIPARNRP